MNYELAKELKESPRERQKRVYWENPERERARKQAWALANKEKVREYRRKTQLTIKLHILNHYGGRCVCCGQDDYHFLSIDHKNDDGHKQRAQHGRSGVASFYYWIKKNGYPDDLQVLCYNCNMGKAIYKICPHQSITN